MINSGLNLSKPYFCLNIYRPTVFLLAKNMNEILKYQI